MNIKEVFCTCTGTYHPPDHWTSGACKGEPMPLPWIDAILNGFRDDPVHRDNKLSATRVLGCPREILIGDNLPVSIDPRGLNNITWGNAVHEYLQRHTSPGLHYAEVEIPPEGEPAPEVFGVPIRGKLDVLAPDFSVIEDYKTHSESAQYWKSKPSVKIENDAVQFNLYRIMIAKALLKVDPETFRPKMRIWHGAMCKAGGTAAWIKHTVPYLTEAECAQFRPSGGTFTVAQIVRIYREAIPKLKAAETEEAKREVIAGLPMVGETMFNGKKCVSYCVLKDTCFGLNARAGQAGVPWI